MSSVVLMRAMVWCSPQFGHCETSSKRRRQYTQRKRPGSCVGRNQGSPQPGQRARRMIRPASSPTSLIPRIITPQPADEETGGPVAVGTKLKTARIGRRSQPRRTGAEVVDGEGRGLAGSRGFFQGGDLSLVLAARDRAGRVDE